MCNRVVENFDVRRSELIITADLELKSGEILKILKSKKRICEVRRGIQSKGKVCEDFGILHNFCGLFEFFEVWSSFVGPQDALPNIVGRWTMDIEFLHRFGILSDWNLNIIECCRGFGGDLRRNAMQQGRFVNLRVH